KGEDRKMTTQLLIASRVVTSIIFTLGAACVLSTFPTAWNLGIGLTASAGIIALVIGFAAKQILTNLLVTLQIALTQSILLGDYVVIDDYKGVEIQSQYIVLKSIEEKRILVPLSRLIDTTYENWSRTSESLSLDFHLY
ncbi:10224_t:CDS:2, partial [Dentiscutata erythropus]